MFWIYIRRLNLMAEYDIKSSIECVNDPFEETFPLCTRAINYRNKVFGAARYLSVRRRVTLAPLNLRN